MAFPAHFIDEVRTRVGLADVVGRRVKLTRKGREHSGLCPFHSEKTPSFTLNEDKGFFHCFGCGKHGSVFDFVMETEGLNFPEAVEKLAAEAGMQVPEQSPEAAQRAKVQAGLHQVMEMAAAWFARQLLGEAGKSARGYLRDRGVQKPAMEHFVLGYAPESRHALKQHLLARDIKDEQLVEAGLVIKPEDGGESYDRFRNRLMFPITDRRGRTIAFGGRALGDAKAKYLNSPETPLFHKGAVLYNLSGARAAARDGAQIIVAEGYMDVIALHEGGFPHAVAPLGTAVTETQLTELWRVSPEPVFCLDGDKAGWNAAIRAAERALPIVKPGHSLKIALLPEGEDPDTLIRNAGPEAMTKLLDEALPLSEVLWRKTAQGQSMDTPERRAGFRKAIFETVREIGDASVRGYYEQYFSDRLDSAFGGARSARQGNTGGRGNKGDRGKKGDWSKKGDWGGKNQRSGGFGGPQAMLKPGQALTDPGIRRVSLLIATLLNHPALIEGVIGDLVGLEILNPELDKLRAEIIDIAGQAAALDRAALKAQLNERGQAAILERLIGSKVKILEKFARPEATDEEAEAGWRELLSLDYRNVGLVKQRQEYAGTGDLRDGEKLVRGMQNVLDEEQHAAGDEDRD